MPDAPNWSADRYPDNNEREMKRDPRPVPSSFLVPRMCRFRTCSFGPIRPLPLQAAVGVAALDRDRTGRNTVEDTFILDSLF